MTPLEISLARSHIYAVGTIDEGIEVLTGMPAGERGETGHYPEGTINARAEKKFIDTQSGRKRLALPSTAEWRDSKD